MKEKIAQLVIDAAGSLNLKVDDVLLSKIAVTYPDPKLGDYATNAALILAKEAKIKPLDLAQQIAEKIEMTDLEKVEAVAPGFINFKLKTELLLSSQADPEPIGDRILVEYFQPNVAKPMHMGLMRTAIIGDAISRMLKFLGHHVESDTHMGDWGTQFGLVLLAYKKYGNQGMLELDPINELNKLYVKINEEAVKHPQIHEDAKQEFVKLERGDSENRALWKKFVDLSLEKFLKINDLMDIQPFDNHWPESFYENKMPKIVVELKAKGFLKESQGAQIVDLENQGLGIALIVKSDGGTTYLLRDLATFIYRKSLGFQKQLYVVDVRQAHAFQQLFAILKLLGHMKDGEATHIDYGFMSFKGEVLSTRKGNMVLAEDVVATAEEKVAKIIAEKNPNLADKNYVIKSVAQGALKYFDLSHNRHSDIEFDWDKALDFEGDSGPYLQYAHARLSSILRKFQITNDKFQTNSNFQIPISITSTERQVLFQSSILPEVAADAVKDFMPNVLANYLYNFAQLLNKFYHESPVIAEKDEKVKNFRLGLIAKARSTLGKGLDLLGIEALEEM